MNKNFCFFVTYIMLFCSLSYAQMSAVKLKMSTLKLHHFQDHVAGENQTSIHALVYLKSGKENKVESTTEKKISNYLEIKERVQNPKFSGIKGYFLLKYKNNEYIVTLWEWENYVTIGKALFVDENIWQEGLDKNGDIGNANDKELADALKGIFDMETNK